MASLYIAEFSSLAVAGDGDEMQVAQWPAEVEQKLTISGTSAASAAFSKHTKAIRVHTDAICSIVIGGIDETPTAKATNARMAADQTEYFGVRPGQKIAVITNT